VLNKPLYDLADQSGLGQVWMAVKVEWSQMELCRIHKATP